jgi:hypothetical protein
MQMEREMADALKEIRTLSVALVATCLLWLLTWPSNAASLMARGYAEHIGAWLLLRDYLSSKEIRDFLSEVDDQQPHDTYTARIPVQSGTEGESKRPFQIESPWPGEGLIRIAIQQVSSDPLIFSIVPRESTDLPFGSYSIILLDVQAKASAHERTVYVVPATFPPSITLRDASNMVFRDGRAAPTEWNTIRTILFSRGWKANDAADLRVNDPIVATFIEESFSASYKVLDLPVAAGYYPSAISLAIGILAFGLVGPMVAISRTPGRLGDSWTMLATVRGKPGGVLESLQLLLSLFVIAIPLVVLCAQASLFASENGVERALWTCSAVGPGAASVVLARVAARVRRIRQFRRRLQSSA